MDGPYRQENYISNPNRIFYVLFHFNLVELGECWDGYAPIALNKWIQLIVVDNWYTWTTCSSLDSKNLVYLLQGRCAAVYIQYKMPQGASAESICSLIHRTH
jgi:hypothetical protein